MKDPGARRGKEDALGGVLATGKKNPRGKTSSPAVATWQAARARGCAAGWVKSLGERRTAETDADLGVICTCCGVTRRVR